MRESVPRPGGCGHHHRFSAWVEVWQNVALSPVRPDPLIRSPQCPSRYPARCSPPGEREPHHTQPSRRHHRRVRQDPFEAPGQGPGAAVPHRRRRLPQEARRPGDRGDRQVPPQGGPVVHRRRLRPGAVLAGRRRSAERRSGAAPEDHRRLAEVQGPAGPGGHPQGGRAQARQARDLQRGPQGRGQGAQGRRRDQEGRQEGGEAGRGRGPRGPGCRGSRRRGSGR